MNWSYRDLVGADKAIQLRPWLYTIARNRCFTILRARRERPLGEASRGCAGAARAAANAGTVASVAEGDRPQGYIQLGGASVAGAGVVEAYWR